MAIDFSSAQSVLLERDANGKYVQRSISELFGLFDSLSGKVAHATSASAHLGSGHE